MDFKILLVGIFLSLELLGVPKPVHSAECSLVFDRKERSSVLRHYRTAQTPFKDESRVTREGLDQLKVSASAQPSEEDIRILKSSIPSGGKLILIDLRREYHGLVNGEPIFWKEGHKPSNDQERHLLEQKMLERLMEQEEIFVSDLAGQVYMIPRATLLTEKETALIMGVESMRFPTKNLIVPSDVIVEQFIDFVSGLEPDTYVHLHCREGMGRATTFMVMFDMLHNADKVSKEEIIRRQHLIGGAYLETYDRYKSFMKFLDKFYLYAQMRLKDPSLCWVESCMERAL